MCRQCVPTLFGKTQTFRCRQMIFADHLEQKKNKWRMSIDRVQLCSFLLWERSCALLLAKVPFPNWSQRLVFRDVFFVNRKVHDIQLTMKHFFVIRSAPISAENVWRHFSFHFWTFLFLTSRWAFSASSVTRRSCSRTSSNSLQNKFNRLVFRLIMFTFVEQQVSYRNTELFPRTNVTNRCTS